MQDEDETNTNDAYGEDPFEYDEYSDDSELFDTISHE